MSVRLDGELIHLEGDSPVADAEALVGLLQRGARRVDVSACRQMHAAVLQALLAFRPAMQGRLEDSFLSQVLDEALR